MKNNIKKFVEEYNERMSWNKDILNSLDIDYIKNNKTAKQFVEKCLSTKEINEENTDLEHAKIYEYTDDDSMKGTLEMQAFSNETYGDKYFWVKPDMGEQEYKKDKIKHITDKIDKDIDNIKNELNKLNTTYIELQTLKKMFK